MTVVGQPSEFAGWHFPRCDGSICARTSYEDGEHLGTKEPPNRLTLTFKCRIKRREAWLPSFLAREHNERDFGG